MSRRRSRAQRPVPSTVDTDEVLDRLAEALSSSGRRPTLTLSGRRLAGRSTLYFVDADPPAEGCRRLVVKQPHPEWETHQLASPLDARAEYDVLWRLHDHFQTLDAPIRVPVPVAALPEIGAFAMELVPGRTLQHLSRFVAVSPSRALSRGHVAAGRFLRHLHGLEVLGDDELDLAGEADRTADVLTTELEGQGVTPPGRVLEVLAGLPRRPVVYRRVVQHGDFHPTNVLLDDDGWTYGLDATLDTTGPAEDDVVRFVAFMSGTTRMAPEEVLPERWRARRKLEQSFFRGYYGQDEPPPLFDVRYLQLLVQRWCRLRDLSEHLGRRSLQVAKRGVIDHHMRELMRESAARLAEAS